jgi:hypothetical protein
MPHQRIRAAATVTCSLDHRATDECHEARRRLHLEHEAPTAPPVASGIGRSPAYGHWYLVVGDAATKATPVADSTQPPLHEAAKWAWGLAAAMLNEMGADVGHRRDSSRAC